MKQFWTLCLAAAVAGGTALSADAGISLQQAMQMHKEGKAIKAGNGVIKRLDNSVRPIRQAPVSRFHKMKGKKVANANKAPQKIMANGDNLFGYLAYTTDYSLNPGVYELSDYSEPILKWENELYMQEYASPSGFGYSEGVLKGYSVASFYGYVFGSFYSEFDAETGEILVLKTQDIEENPSYFETVAYDPENKQFFGYGIMEDEFVFMSAPESDPFNYTSVRPVYDEEVCLGMTYNPEEKAIIGVNLSNELVKISSDGAQEVLMNLDVPDISTALCGIGYDPLSSLYYWNFVRSDYTSAMATIDVRNKMLNIISEHGEETMQYTVLYTTDEFVMTDAPLRPSCEEGAVNFYKDSFIGYVTFTMPTEKGDGNAITENLSYNAYLDGKVYSVGNAAPGEIVNINFAVSEEGMHSFGMSAVLNGVEGAAVKTMAYIGNDTPLAPTNVTLTEKEISWDAVTSGLHGGYVDVSAMTYTVSINGEVVGTTEQTVLAHTFDPEVELNSYTAEVVANCKGKTGSSSYSNSIATGAALKLPQYLEPTTEQFALFNVVDNNEDGASWINGKDYDDGTGYVYTTYSAPGVQMDDWLFLPKMSFEDAEKFYSFSFNVALRSNDYSNEYVEVLLCSEPSSSSNGVVTTIIPEFSPESSDYELATSEFKVPESGVYYIALHCTSDGDMFGVKASNFAIEDNNITSESPVAIDDLLAEPGPGGAAMSIVTFTMPTKTMGGEEIPSTKELKATVSGGAAVAEVSGKPGEEMTVEVAAFIGNNTFNVVVSDGELNSPVAITSVRCGYDVPSTVTEVRSSTSEDMLTMTIEWDPVTTGWIDDNDEYGGTIDPSKVVYNIYMVVNGYWELYDTGLTETSYSYTVAPGTTQNMVWLGVEASNDAGDNGYLRYAGCILGDPMALPLGDDFEGEELSSDLWLTYDDFGAPQFGTIYTSDLSDAYADKETTCFLITGSGWFNGEEGRYGSPRFSTKGENNVTVTLDVCGDFTLPHTTILAETYGVDPVSIGEITCSEPGFHKVSVSLPEEFLNKSWVGIYIKCEFDTGEEMLAIESISIEGSSGIRTLDMSGVKIAGGKNQIKVSGLQNQNVVVSSVDGRVAAKSDRISGDATFNVEKGIYVVKAGNKNAKVVVR